MDIVIYLFGPRLEVRHLRNFQWPAGSDFHGVVKHSSQAPNIGLSPPFPSFSVFAQPEPNTFPFGVLGRSRLPFIFFSTQPAPNKTGVIPAVLPVKGLR
jgi:hypothetical protein